MKHFCLLLCIVHSLLLQAGDVGPMVQRGEQAYREGRWVEARSTYLRAAALAVDETEKLTLLNRAGEINLELLMSPYEQPETIWLEVQPGDTLGKIAERAGTTIELLIAMNRMSSHKIRLGRRLKVLFATFDLVIDKSDNTAILRLDGQFFKRYEVSTGAAANTPVGQFKITERIVHPDWWHPVSKERIPYGAPGHKIGTRWLGWDVKGFGIHGTDEPEKIGQAVSLGCVRMRNAEVEELFMLLPSGTKVEVKE